MYQHFSPHKRLAYLGDYALLRISYTGTPLCLKTPYIHSEIKQKLVSTPYREDILESLTNNSKPSASVETNLFIYDFDSEPSYK